MPPSKSAPVANPSQEHGDFGRIQRADLYEHGVVLELFTGERSWLLLRCDLAIPTQTLTARPTRDDESPPPAAQKMLRAEVVPGQLLALDHDQAAAVLTVSIVLKGGKRRVLYVEHGPSDPRIVLCAQKEKGARVLSVLLGARRPQDGRDLRKGKLYVVPVQQLADPRHDLGPSAQAAPPPVPVPARPAPERALRARVKKERKRLQRLKAKLQGDLHKHGDPKILATAGEALKAVLHLHKPGLREFKGADDVGEEVVIPLDPARSATANLEQLFRRARRARVAQDKVQPRLLEVTARQMLLAELLERWLMNLDADEEATAQEETAQEETAQEETAQERLQALLMERDSGGGHRARLRHREGPRRPFRLFRATGNIEIKVGRNARDNDNLTFHIARGNDTWMHCRNVHGSHVIIPTTLEALTEALLLDAAHLAAHFSGARGEPRADVQYTARKHVRKPGKGAAAGSVHLSFERVLHLVVDDERLRRLLRAEIAPGGSS